jgi:dipeptidyl-peptidase-4
VRLHRADSGALARVLYAEPVRSLGRYRLGKPEFVQVPTRDGFVMEAMLIRPPDFDPAKRYPVWCSTYGGPRGPQVQNRWGGTTYLWHQLLAQKGYVIWICDNRTASGKGAESAWPLYRNFGELELRDLEDGLNWLKAKPWIDGTRIGIGGWSFGGYMTEYALTHSRSFKIGIAGAGVSDWRLYDTIYTERYMSTPQKNPEGYKKSAPLTRRGGPFRVSCCWFTGPWTTTSTCRTRSSSLMSCSGRARISR